MVEDPFPACYAAFAGADNLDKGLGQLTTPAISNARRKPGGTLSTLDLNLNLP